MMRGSEQPVLRDIVLVGGGHSHVGVIRRFGMKPMPGVRLTVICRDTHTPYSGMLPGYVAGHYSYDEVHVDLRRLAEFAGARFYSDSVTGIDRAAQKVICAHRPPVPYDLVSINIGSTPQMSQVTGAEQYAVPVKPIGGFNDRWLALLARVREQSLAMRIAVVGAGAGGVELTLAMQYRLRNELRSQGRSPDLLEFHLLTASDRILPTHNAYVRNKFSQVLRDRGVVVHCNAQVDQVSATGLHATSGQTVSADEIIWVTQAGGAHWLRDTGLQLDESGFIKVRDTLQTLDDPKVFAAGDIANVLNHPREKAGVFAVRQGRPLEENLRLALQELPTRDFTPQRSWLALISTGDKHAIASRGFFGASGDWIWR